MYALQQLGGGKNIVLLVKIEAKNAIKPQKFPKIAYAGQGVSWLLMWFSVVVMKNWHLQGIACALTVLSELAVGS